MVEQEDGMLHEVRMFDIALYSIKVLLSDFCVDLVRRDLDTSGYQTFRFDAHEWSWGYCAMNMIVIGYWFKHASPHFRDVDGNNPDHVALSDNGIG